MLSRFHRIHGILPLPVFVALILTGCGRDPTPASPRSYFVTIGQTTINLNRIAYIQPSFCEDNSKLIATLKQYPRAVNPNDDTAPPAPEGSCSFSVIFENGEYTTTVNGNSISANYKVGSHTTFKIEFGVDHSLKTQVEATTALAELRNKLPG